MTHLPSFTGLPLSSSEPKYLTGVKAETPSSQEPNSYGWNSYCVAFIGGVHWFSSATTPIAVMMGKGALKSVKFL